MNTESNTYWIYDTTISFENKTERSPEGAWHKHKFRHYGYFYQLLNMLDMEGFNVQNDPEVGKLIRKNY